MTICQTASRNGPPVSANTLATRPSNAARATCQPAPLLMKAKPMTRIATLVSALVIAAAIGAPAHAADFAPVVGSKVVKLSDLDLNTSAGARKALSRIERAARALCTVSPTRLTASQASEQRACTEAATIAAVNRTHSQMLSVALSARMGKTELARR